jgi:small subunit ribosomal protein S20|tara:strand:- start:235 stop:489 length:255 start_codon:yes stop_codon:yes gene_type:complete
MSAKGTVLKRAKQSIKANIRNKNYKSALKTTIKKTMNESNKEKATKLADEAFSTIDKAASKGVIHKNKAANKKSKISNHIKNMT